MRVKVENVRSPGGYDFGEFVGLYLDNGRDRCGSDTPLMMVRKDRYGMMLSAHHPSTVTPVTPAEEYDSCSWNIYNAIDRSVR